MKKERAIRILLAIIVLAVPLIAGGCPPGTYTGGYTGPGFGGYNNPPFVYNTTINLYLRVIDPIGYAVPGCVIDLYVSGRHYHSYSSTSGQFWPIYNAFPGEWANFNESFVVEANRYVGQSLNFRITLNRWGFMIAEKNYNIPSLDRDTVYVFFDEIVMLPY